MPLIVISPSLHYYYTDSGPPSDNDNLKYKTLVLTHGHTFHSGTFQRLLPLAASRSMRIICVNRREYPGTTSYTEEEANIIVSGNDEQKYDLMEQLGIEFALFIDGLIKECGIPKEGGVTVGGWSMGASFILSLISSVGMVSETIRSNLQAYVKGFILWDPPVHALGTPDIPDEYIPLFDTSIPTDQRGIVFGTWVSSYFEHGNILSHDLSQLNTRATNTSTRTASIEKMTFAEVSSMIDVGVKRIQEFETIMVGRPFAPAVNRHLIKALFDPSVRTFWKKTSLVHLMGDSGTWNIIYASWVLQDLIKNTFCEELHFKLQILPGANHFAMWDFPELTIDALAECLD